MIAIGWGDRDRPGRCHRRLADDSFGASVKHHGVRDSVCPAGRRDADQGDRDGRGPQFRLNHSGLDRLLPCGPGCGVAGPANGLPRDDGSDASRGANSGLMTT